MVIDEIAVLGEEKRNEDLSKGFRR